MTHQPGILSTIRHHIEHSTHLELLEYLDEIHCQLDDWKVSVDVLTLLYHHVKFDVLDFPQGPCCCDNGEHLQLLDDSCAYALTPPVADQGESNDC